MQDLIWTQHLPPSMHMVQRKLVHSWATRQGKVGILDSPGERPWWQKGLECLASVLFWRPAYGGVIQTLEESYMKFLLVLTKRLKCKNVLEIRKEIENIFLFSIDQFKLDVYKKQNTPGYFHRMELQLGNIFSIWGSIFIAP